MSMPFYVPPEQVMKDRADFARKGIARGRSVVVLGYDKGIAFVAENPSRALHKVSEIYDRIAFAAVGRYNEFESLRVAGIRYADLRGYSYDRTDVTARALANSYAQTIGAVFTQEQKPFEIEIVVAEVGATADGDQIFRLTYDGSVADEQGFVAMGGASDVAEQRLRQTWRPGLSLAQALRLAADVLTVPVAGPASASAAHPTAGPVADGAPNGVGSVPGHHEGAPAAPLGEGVVTGPPTAPPRAVDASTLEVAVLDRERTRRTFRRVTGALLEALLSADDPTTDAPRSDEGHLGHPELLSGEPQTPEAPGAPG